LNRSVCLNSNFRKLNKRPAATGRAIGGANAKFARLSVLVAIGGNVIGSKGVTAVISPC